MKVLNSLRNAGNRLLEVIVAEMMQPEARKITTRLEMMQPRMEFFYEQKNVEILVMLQDTYRRELKALEPITRSKTYAQYATWLRDFEGKLFEDDMAKSGYEKVTEPDGWTYFRKKDGGR